MGAVTDSVECHFVRRRVLRGTSILTLSTHRCRVTVRHLLFYNGDSIGYGPVLYILLTVERKGAADKRGVSIQITNETFLCCY